MKNCLIYETLNSVNEMKKVQEQNGLVTLSGIFGVCGIRNRNQRVYEKSNYGKCVAEMKKRIAEGGAIPGELEHPNTSNITLENVSHKITDINIDEDGVVTGTIQLLNTPKGKIAQAIVEGGLPLFISSRASGKVDKNGNVTLENISSYDLVGTPGFAEARMHLNESMQFTQIDENLCIISDKKEIVENNEDMDNKELLEKLEALESRIESLEEQNEELEEALAEAKSKQINLGNLAAGIQKWIIEEYSPTVETWLKTEFGDHMIKENKRAFANEIAPKIQQWIVEEYSPEIQQWICEQYSPQVEKWVCEQYSPEVEKWVCEQYSPEVEKWVLENVAPGIQGWLTEHFAPEIENWLHESYSESIRDMISESLKNNKDNKLKSITETLSLLESIDAKKPQFNGRQINEAINEPKFIQDMPEEYRPKYNMASQDVKESIMRRAKLFDFSVEGSTQRFWESVDFNAAPAATNIYEGLDSIEDERERAIRASFRRHRTM